MNKCVERIYNGIIKENPTFVLMLGMCPTLAVTTTAINGVGMGLSTTAVLVFSNLIISALRKIIPDRVRIPAYIVVVASLVTIVQLLLQAFIPSLYESLGIFIPLIVVNCIILGRAEAYAAKNGPVESAFDGVGMGLGFTVGLTCIAIFREILGSGSVFGIEFIPEAYRIAIFGLAPGAFFVLAGLTALQNKFKAPSATNGSVAPSKLACGGNCLSCSGSACMANHNTLETKRLEELAKAEEAKKAALAKKMAEQAANAGKKEE
ncbi:MAG TPA: electron transport complex subunit E [Candidatus Ventrimonas merdavium]|nr:electron transport complex subunit E [Candidatus Ventrimonas merdavium]